jgi:hypothetical protein
MISFFPVKSFAQKPIDSDSESTCLKANNQENVFFTSGNVDFIQINSSVTDSVKFAVVVHKPDKPSPILLFTHGWHGSVKPPAIDSQNPYENFLTVQVDMRGRKYSSGKADCNGLELSFPCVKPLHSWRGYTHKSTGFGCIL